MESNEYKTLFALEDTYWWYQARRTLVQEMLASAVTPRNDQVVVDLGCGTGANAAVLKQFGNPVLVDVSPEAIQFCKQRGLGKLMQSSLESVALRSRSVDVATALDILEHLDDDLAGMQEVQRILKPNGVFLITVPAFGFLWSEHDEALHHRRRYTADELRAKLTASGFEMVRTTYFIMMLFFPIAVIRVWQGIFKKNVSPKTSHVILPRWVNFVIERLLALERVLCRHVNLPFGVSIVAIARVPAEKVPVRSSDQTEAMPQEVGVH